MENKPVRERRAEMNSKHMQLTAEDLTDQCLHAKNAQTNGCKSDESFIAARFSFGDG